MAEKKAPGIWVVDPNFSTEGDLELFDSDNLADVLVKCGDHTWKLHKAILCTRNTWFKKALIGPFKESKTRVVTLDEEEQCDIDCLLKFIYTGCIDLLASYPGHDEFVALMRIWKTANFFQQTNLCELTVFAANDCANKHAQAFCRASPGADHQKNMEGVMENSFNPAVSLLYGKEMEHLRTTFLPIYMAMAITSVHQFSENEAFRTLLADVPRFATDWVTELMKSFHKWTPGSVGKIGRCCTQCGKDMGGKGSVQSMKWVRSRYLMIVCDRCYQMPTLAEWTSTKE